VARKLCRLVPSPPAVFAAGVQMFRAKFDCRIGSPLSSRTWLFGRQEVEVERNGTDRFHFVLYLRRNCLRRAWTKHNVDRRLCPCGEPHVSRVNCQPSPPISGDSVRLAKPRWHRVFVELRSGSNDVPARRQFGAIARPTVQGLAEHRRSTFGRQYPGPVVQRSLVAHVMTVATGQFGDPIASVVLAVSDDRSLHPLTVRPAAAAR